MEVKKIVVLYPSHSPFFSEASGHKTSMNLDSKLAPSKVLMLGLQWVSYKLISTSVLQYHFCRFQHIFCTLNKYMYSGTLLNGNPSTSDTHDITDNSESPDPAFIQFNT